MSSHHAHPVGPRVLADDDGEPFWFLNTLTINKLGGDDTQGGFSLVDHRMPAGFAPPPHLHHGADEAFYVLDGRIEGFCGEQEWSAGPGTLVFLPRDVPTASASPTTVPAGRC